jgi:DNA-binding transcriptional LysR family regulator
LTDTVGDIELFVAIVEAGGISAAALALESSPPVVSRRLTMLESRLGIRLAERSARRFRLTEEGTLYYERGRAILSGLREMEAEVAARGTAAHGLLRVGAPMELGRCRVALLLASFAELHPGLRAHLVLSDAGFEIEQDGLDVALRFGQPEDESLISRKLATVPRIVCGSPEYLAARGIPEKPEDLFGHECLRLARRRGVAETWDFRYPDGIRAVRISGRLSSSSGEALHRWALDGKGLSLEARWDVEDDLKAGRLVEVLSESWCDSVELFAIFLPSRPAPPRIRLFVDYVAAAFKAEISL